MLYLILFLTHFDIVCCIIGGHYVHITKVPYQLGYGDRCGAVLIDKNWALTTAHCGSNNTYVRVGSTNHLRGVRIKIKYHFVHPLYKRKHEFDYDVQLLKFFRKLLLNKNVMPVSIGVNHGDSVWVTGWGYPKEKGDYSETLQQVNMKLVPMNECQNINVIRYNNTLTNRMFCAGDKDHDACQGDSGDGAISKDGTLVGLSSFGYGCGRGIPGVFMNLTDPGILTWINNVKSWYKDPTTEKSPKDLT